MAVHWRGVFYDGHKWFVVRFYHHPSAICIVVELLKSIHYTLHLSLDI